MGKINVGIIGFGLSGRYFFSPYIETYEGFHLNAIVTSQSDLVTNEYPNAKVYSTVKLMLNDTDIDLIIVASPNYTHFEYTKMALEAGKHVIVEKPFTVTTTQASKLIAQAKQKNLVLAPFQNRRWDGDFLTVKKIIDSGDLGEIVEFESHFDRYRPLYDRVQWKNELREGNGVLYDLGPHLIDQALALFGKPHSLFADIKTHRIHGEVDDYFDIHLYYGKMKAILKAGVMVREQGPRFVVHGHKGSFVKYGLDPQENNLRNGMLPQNPEIGEDTVENYGLIHAEIHNNIRRERVVTTPGNYMCYFENVYNAINDNEPLQIDAHNALNLIDIIEKAYTSSTLQKVIQV